MSLEPRPPAAGHRPLDETTEVLRELPTSESDLLTVRAEAYGGHDVVTVAGEIDLATGPQLREVLTELLARGRSHLVLDLDRVTFIDSTGLGVLVGVHRKILGAGGSLSLVCGDPRCLRVLEITGLRRVFTFFPSVADAISAKQRGSVSPPSPRANGG